MLTRRGFLKTSSLLATVVHARPSYALPKTSPTILVYNGRHRLDADPHALAALAVDAARSAGASYADVRLTNTREEFFKFRNLLQEIELLGVGVRVLVNGYWGFASNAVWTSDSMGQLARQAVLQAKANAMGKTREVTLGVIPVAKGVWTMPVKYDPFDIPLGEKMDVMNDATAYARALMNSFFPELSMRLRRQRTVFASTEGSSWEQTTYLTEGDFQIAYRQQPSLGLPLGQARDDLLSPAGKGWEHISESRLIDQIPRILDDAEQIRHTEPVEPGRYDVVFSAQAMATLVSQTIGTATELDRALGYEANAGGTSYLDDPLEMLGTYRVGNTMVNVTADRSTPGGAASVKWDADAVVPESFPLVTKGILVDYQTTREQAAWLAPYYQKSQRAVQSHGCAWSEGGLSLTTQHPPNFRLLPGESDTSLDDLVAGVKKGVLVTTVDVHMDQQQRAGVMYPLMRRITNGKPGPFIANGSIMFQTAEIWNNIQAIGGAPSERWFGLKGEKGEPTQQTVHSAGAVPCLVKNVAVLPKLRS